MSPERRPPFVGKWPIGSAAQLFERGPRLPEDEEIVRVTGPLRAVGPKNACEQVARVKVTHRQWVVHQLG